MKAAGMVPRRSDQEQGSPHRQRTAQSYAISSDHVQWCSESTGSFLKRLRRLHPLTGHASSISMHGTREHADVVDVRANPNGDVEPQSGACMNREQAGRWSSNPGATTEGKESPNMDFDLGDFAISLLLIISQRPSYSSPALD